jgi:hypothetical protein
MAGIMFTDNNSVLGGYNSHTLAITGIGGKKKGDETSIQTAIRETVEELFEFEEIPNELLEFLFNNLTFNTVFSRGGYSTYVMDFQYDLEVMLDSIHRYSLKSRVYDPLPQTLADLLLKRKNDINAEFSHLVLLPFARTIDIAGCFINDIRHLKPIQ